MKKLFLLSAFMVFAAISVSAQNNTISKPASKIDFDKKVQILNGLITQHKIEKAGEQWADINRIIQAQFMSMEELIETAQSAGDKINGEKYRQAGLGQSQIYSDLIMYAADLSANKIKIDSLLQQYGKITYNF